MLNEINLARIDLNLLVLFEAVMRERHVARAATRLNLTASAVSHGIRRLRLTFNDPLFVKHPKGVVPTARASALSAPIAEILSQLREVVASAEPFDPARSTRRFTIGAPDATAAVVLPAVLAKIETSAPGIDVGVRDVQPADTLAALDAGRFDVALYPLDDLPARFDSRPLYEEDFVIAARQDHAIGKRPSLDRYCAARHLLVSYTGDAHGFVDQVLEKLGRKRRIMLTVPSFMWALAVIAESNLIGTLPGALVRTHGRRFGVIALPPPMPISRFHIKAVAPHAAMTDAGVLWLMDMIQNTWRAQAIAKKAR